MFTDDKLFATVCTLALLTTVGAFLWVHQGSIAGAMVSRSTVAEASLTPTVEVQPQPRTREDIPRDLARVSNREEESDFVYTASVVSEAALPQPTLDASDVETLQRILEGIASGTEIEVPGHDVPQLSEVLVRRDRDGRMVVAPGTHRRYDGLAVAFAAIEAPGFFDLVAEEMLDDRLREAVLSLLAVDAPRVEPDMVARGAHWGFADADFEALGSAQKHLLLMGRENAAIVRAKLMELRELIGDTGELSPVVPPESNSGDLLVASVEATADVQGAGSTP